jgi:hypothetical protein
MLIDGVISHLGQASAITALVGDHIYKNRAPRGFKLPAIILHKYGGAQDYDFDGPVDISEAQIQADVYAADENGCGLMIAAIRSVLDGFVGTLPDGTVVQACYYEREMDMPFLAYGDQKSDTNRSLIGYRFVIVRV